LNDEIETHCYRVAPRSMLLPLFVQGNRSSSSLFLSSVFPIDPNEIANLLFAAPFHADFFCSAHLIWINLIG